MAATEPAASGESTSVSASRADGTDVGEPDIAGPAVSGSGRSGVDVRALVVLATVALVAVGLDQLSKYLVETRLPLGEPVPVLGEVLQFLYIKNSGAAFSLASGYTWIFSIAASAVTVFIVLFARRIRSITWAVLFGMLLGGTVGNLIDRLFREPSFGVGHVVDFIQVIYFPAIFNIADSFIVVSMALFVILTLRGVGLDGTRAERPGSADEKPGTADDAAAG